MKIFKDNYKPIELQVVNRNGETIMLKSRFITQKEWLELFDPAKQSKKYTYNCIFMATVFGGKPADYENYSAELLTEVITYYNEQIKTPIPAQD